MNKEIKEKIILLGSSGVGKSSILYKYMKGVFTEGFAPAYGIEFQIKKIDYKSHSIKLHIWDPADQSRYRHSMPKSFYKGTMGAIIIFDLTKTDSFEEQIEHYLRVLKYNSDKEDNLIRVLVVLVGNKIDLCIDDPKSRQVTRDEIDNKIEEINEEYGIKINYFESSAKTGTNINEIFEVFFEELKKKCENEEINKPSIILDSKNQEKKNKCFN